MPTIRVVSLIPEDEHLFYEFIDDITTFNSFMAYQIYIPGGRPTKETFNPDECNEFIQDYLYTSDAEIKSAFAKYKDFKASRKMSPKSAVAFKETVTPTINDGTSELPNRATPKKANIDNSSNDTNTNNDGHIGTFQGRSVNVAPVPPALAMNDKNTPSFGPSKPSTREKQMYPAYTPSGAPKVSGYQSNGKTTPNAPISGVGFGDSQQKGQMAGHGYTPHSQNTPGSSHGQGTHYSHYGYPKVSKRGAFKQEGDKWDGTHEKFVTAEADLRSYALTSRMAYIVTINFLTCYKTHKTLKKIMDNFIDDEGMTLEENGINYPQLKHDSEALFGAILNLSQGKYALAII